MPLMFWVAEQALASVVEAQRKRMMLKCMMQTHSTAQPWLCRTVIELQCLGVPRVVLDFIGRSCETWWHASCEKSPAGNLPFEIPWYVQCAPVPSVQKSGTRGEPAEKLRGAGRSGAQVWE